MTESAKTFLFVVAAAAAMALAVFTRPSFYTASPNDKRGQALFPEFSDPLSVAGMEVTEFDEYNATLDKFRVTEAEQRGKIRWVIPSRENYPADATQQVGAAAAGLRGLRVISVVSDSQGDQKLYGVVDPDPRTLKVGDTGVGARVTMSNKDGKVLADLIIGKEVADHSSQRYVRKPGQEPIYIVEVKTDNFSTKFENWIERNLLQINTLDMEHVQVQDYALRQTGEIDYRRKMELDYSDTGKDKWKLSDDEKFINDRPGGRWAPVKMAADEQLDTAKLDSLRTALDDLQIVDVSRKPAGLSGDLKVSRDFLRNEASVRDLRDRGFIAGRLGDGPEELYSADGEIRIQMKDGVEYVLRFGDIASRSSAKKNDKGKSKGKQAEKGDDADEKKDGGGLNRYVLVMAEFNPKLIAKPHFEPLPEFKPDAGQPAMPSKAAGAAPKPDAKKPGGEQPEATKPASVKADGKKIEAKKPDGKPDAKKPEARKPASKTKEQLAAEKKAFEADRARVEKENKRKQDEYDRAVADGKKRVAELNARFADWYYIISDEVYRKIHLGREEIVKKKEKPKAKDKDAKHAHARGEHGDAPDASASPIDEFEKLKEEGAADRP